MTELRHAFTRDEITAYAEASGDRNPIHLDDDFARSVGLPGVIVHGMLQMGRLTSLAVAEAGGDPRRVRRVTARFAAMVEPGDELVFTASTASAGAPTGTTGDGDRLSLAAARADGTPVLTKAFAEIG